MEQANKKYFTDTGKEIARFTMRVEFKPQFWRVKETTGEVIENWTYRSDIENQKLQAKGITRPHPLDALGIIYLRWKERFKSVQIFDNTLPPNNQLLFYQVDSKIIHPVNPEKFNQWLKRL